MLAGASAPLDRSLTDAADRHTLLLLGTLEGAPSPRLRTTRARGVGHVHTPSPGRIPAKVEHRFVGTSRTSIIAGHAVTELMRPDHEPHARFVRTQARLPTAS